MSPHSTSHPAPHTASTTGGPVRGHLEHGLTVFRGVPYATAPERFAPPEPVPAWTDVRDTVTDGPVGPQSPSHFDPVLGTPAPREQAEDCLTLTITTPAPDDRARPVLVWFHGGAWITGAGSLPWYDGHRLATEGDIVVVAVNYRLGAFGYLRAPGVSEGNLGLRDQIAALRWVHDNIAAFGGDPAQVTVAGQSAGAHSVQCLLGIPEARTTFRRAILHSSPAGLGLGDARAAERTARGFLRALGADPRTAPVADVLAAQDRYAQAAARPLGLNVTPAFRPVEGVGPLPARDQWVRNVRASAGDLQVVIGFTAQEMTGFLVPNPAVRRLRRVPALGPRAVSALERTAGRFAFTRPVLRLADRLSGAGAAVWAFRFDYAASGNPFGATHCVDLPFLFGTDAWADAPMLRGADPEEVEALGRRMRAAWLGFVRTGNPDGEQGSWPAYRGPGEVKVWA
ncbi:carboxylesterase family protein [Streptomyces sp. NPDC048290]|uniref:carboxylesterase/lipase family protein n=1 Tax=Streptomyces sp. NPDC048290 TaxID=3155811 RepID=UPI003429EF16